MSIGAIISAGADLAGVGQGFLFNYTRHEYEIKVAELEELIARLNQHLDRLQELRSQIPQFWDDENARETGVVLDKTIKRVLDAMNLSENLSRTYKSTIEALGGSKDTLAGLIGEAMGILDSDN